MTRDPERLFLVGFMGCGKSSVAAALAQRLGWGMVDTDARVEAREGCSIDTLFREGGEGRFHRAEWEVLTALDREAFQVVATGGGLFAGAAHRRWIRAHGIGVWLDAPLATCAARVGTGTGRPRWLPSDVTGFRAFFEKRRAIYALAEVRVEAGSGSPAEVAERVLARLSGRLPPGGR